jgi:uncharacterized membrane protein YkoI
MKYLIWVALLVTSTISVCSAKVTPPAAVIAAFKQKFPSATAISWGKESAKEYEAEFTNDGKKYSANFNQAGQWLETESAADFTTFPEKVKASFNKQHKGAKKFEVALIQKADGSMIYEIQIKVGVKRKDCLYKEDGSSL